MLKFRKNNVGKSLVALLCCLIFLLSACSLLPGNSSNGAYLAPIPSATTAHPLSLSPIPSATPLSDSDLAAKMVQNMTLDQKLGQMGEIEHNLVQRSTYLISFLDEGY